MNAHLKELAKVCGAAVSVVIVLAVVVSASLIALKAVKLLLIALNF